MAGFFEWADTALGNIANYTGSKKEELVGGIFNSISKTISTGKPVIALNKGDATVTGAQVTDNGIKAQIEFKAEKSTLSKTLWWISGAIVIAVLLAYFLPKLFSNKKKKYRYA